MGQSAERPVSVVQVAAGGYGEFYVSRLLDGTPVRPCRLVGIVDPLIERSPRQAALRALGLPIVPSLEDFYAAGRADLAVIASPIHLHCPQTCTALAHGSHVLCEKPVAATVQEVARMADARDRAGRFVAIGYQWAFSPAVHKLKADILAGVYGAAKRLKCIVLWPRADAYYGRNDWAGRLRMDSGAWVLDSPVSNATAHYLQLMLYLIGKRAQHSAVVTEVMAELYRAKPIESFDTGVARIRTACGAELLFYASHAVRESHGPVFDLAFERARIRWDGTEKALAATLGDGSSRAYGDFSAEPDRKLWDAVGAVHGGAEIACGLQAAGQHTVVVNGMHESVPEIAPLPREQVAVTGEPGNRHVWMRGLAETLKRCFAEARLPHETGAAWARAGQPVSLAGYARFPGSDAVERRILAGCRERRGARLP